MSGGYGGSGSGNTGPGAAGARGGVGSGRGGIGGSGVGWSGSGAESRSAAAHAGANVGRGGGGSSSSSGSGRGPGSTVGAGRRSDASRAFGAVGRGISNAIGGIGNAFGGLTQGLADAVGGVIGVSQQDKTSTLGQIGWEGPGTESRAKAGKQDVDTGFGLAKGVQTGKTIGGFFGLGAPVEGISDVAAKSMTPDAQRAYNSAMDARSSLTSLGSFAAKAAGVPAAPATNIANMADLASVVGHIEGYNPDTQTKSPAVGRRNSALAAFGRSGSSASNPLSPQAPQDGLLKRNWEPASYGFGEYGSHIKALAS